jgi:hypothetical protein
MWGEVGWGGGAEIVLWEFFIETFRLGNQPGMPFKSRKEKKQEDEGRLGALSAG